MTDDPRPLPFVGVPRLAESPLDSSRVPDRTRLRAITTGAVEHGCTIETYSCVTDGGAAPPQPSLVLAHVPEFEFLESTPRQPRVRFEWDGTVVRSQVRLPEGSSFYGLGERAGPLLRNDRLHLQWNTDAWCYGEASPALYQSHPWVLAVRPDGSATGVLFDTPRRGTIACAADGVEGAFETEPYDVHVIDGEAPQDVLKGLAAMIGTIARPPRWALGYHQCRWSYMDADEVLAIAHHMREHKVPCDAIWFDIDYMDRHRVFTWSKTRFPRPKHHVEELQADGFHAVAIVDPGIAIAVDYDVFEEGREGEHFVLDASGEPASGRVWPGLCHWPDFTRKETRGWWARHVRRFLMESGLDGLWNDMNEPAVQRTPAGTLPDDAVHRGEPGGTHARIHNLYGQQMAQATLDGWRAAHPDRRPFVLTRANHLSGSRLAATWTGDNQSRWEDLAWSIPMVLNLGLSGQPFSGPDVGGFYGDPDAELFVRWFELGAYLPFCRGHSEKHSCRKEPWSFGDEALGHVRSALQRRMRLLPTFVTLFEEAHRTGLPVCRPVFFADPTDARLRTIDDAFLLGADLLVAPVTERGATTKRIVLPQGRWHDFYRGGAAYTGAEVTLNAPRGSTPVLARAGAIVFEGPVLQHTGARDVERTWQVFLDDTGRASGTLVEDPGRMVNDPVTTLRVTARLDGDCVRVEVERDGPEPPERARRILVHGARTPIVLEDRGVDSVVIGP